MGTAPVSVLVSFAAVRGRSRRTGPGRSSRSQTTLTCREPTPTDLESVSGPRPSRLMLAPVVPYNSEVQQPMRATTALGRHLRTHWAAQSRTHWAAQSDSDQGRAGSSHSEGLDVRR